MILWFVVDFGTAGGYRLAYYEKIWPTVLFFYLGFPLLFSILIYKFGVGDKGLFLGTLITIFIIEILFTRNPLLMSFPTLFWGIPVAVLIYIPLVFFSLWIVKREVIKHLPLIIILTGIELLITTLTIFG